MGKAFRALIATLLFLLCGSALGQDVSGFRLEGPAQVTGDGKTTFEVVVRNAQGGSAVANADIGVDSGRLVARRELDEGGTVLELVPPRVVEPTVMTIAVRIRGLGKTEHRVDVVPALGTSGRFVSKGRLALDVPERLVLGVDQEAEIRFRTPRRGNVRLHASEGLLSAPVRIDAASSAAKYSPPQSKFPGVAIIVALSDDGNVLDWAPIRLYGWPAIATRTEQNASVTVKIEGESFGPIRADHQGRGTVRVLVPPGVAQAKVLARDALGNESAVPLALGVPTSWPLLTLCPAESERVYVFVVGGDGQPRPGAKLDLSASLGELSRPRQIDGYYVSSLSLPPSAQMDAPIVYSSGVEGDPASPSSCESRVVGEAPNRMSGATDPGAWVAGMDPRVKVRVKLAFAGYRTPRVVPVLPRVDIGEVTESKAVSPELYELTWRLPNQLGGRTRAHMVLQTNTATPLVAGVELPISPAEPERLELGFGTERLVADGKSTTTLEVRVVDRFGNLDRTAKLVATATGTISTFRRGRGDTLLATYRAPRSPYIDSDRIEVRLRDRQLAASRVMALDPVRGGIRVMGRVGYTLPLGKLSGPTGLLGAAYRLPMLDGGLFATSLVGVSTGKDTRRDSDNVEDVTVRSTLIPVGAGLHYDLHWEPVSPYVELGPRLGVARLGVRSTSAGEVDGWTTALGAWLGLGLHITLGPGELTLDTEYSYLPVDWGSVNGNLGGLFFGAGYTYEL